MMFFRLLGRSFVVALLGLFHTLLWFFGWLVLAISFRGKARRQKWHGDRLCSLFRSLGPTYIKIGQIISTRPDLVPRHIISSLENLQDDVGTFSYSHVEKSFRNELGKGPDEIFEEFDKKPIASASIAQVHSATLPGGIKVAVKVRRPGIERMMQLDMRILMGIAKLVKIFPSMHIYAPVESVREFGQAIEQQLDLCNEAENNRRFTENFSDDEDVSIPEIYDEYSSSGILTMSFVDGAKVLAYRSLDADPTRLAKIGFHTLLKMIFDDGFVHADLHPGNIFVTPSGSVALIDFGLTASLDDIHRRLFAEFFGAWASSDGVNMARLMVKFSPCAKIPDYQAYESEICEFVKRYDGKSLGEVAVSKVVVDMMGIMRRHRVRVNPVFTMVNLSIGVTEGIGRQLDDSLDLLSETLPFFVELRQRGRI